MALSDTAESNYGYWYPGKNNDGGAGGGFEPRPWGRAWLGNKEMGLGSWWYSGEIDLGYSGALRSAATVFVDDPIFGPVAYGGDATREKNFTQVILRDGLRARFHIVRAKQRVHILLDRDGFAKDQPVSFDNALSVIKFTLENRAGTPHETEIRPASLPPGDYTVQSGNDGGAARQRLSAAGREQPLFRVLLQASGASVEIKRVGSSR